MLESRDATLEMNSTAPERFRGKMFTFSFETPVSGSISGYVIGEHIPDDVTGEVTGYFVMTTQFMTWYGEFPVNVFGRFDKEAFDASFTLTWEDTPELRRVVYTPLLA